MDPYSYADDNLLDEFVIALAAAWHASLDDAPFWFEQAEAEWTRLSKDAVRLGASLNHTVDGWARCDRGQALPRVCEELGRLAGRGASAFACDRRMLLRMVGHTLKTLAAQRGPRCSMRTLYSERRQRLAGFDCGL